MTTAGRHFAAGRSRARWRTPGLSWLVALVLLGLLVVLVRTSLHQYDTFDLSLDYGVFAQALHQIAHGSLDPYNSLQGLSYWRSHGEVVMWLLAPLHWLHSDDGSMLLVVQDLSFVVGIGAAASWYVAVCRERRARAAVEILGVGVLLVLALANPWLYLTADQDFHFEATGAALVLLAGRDLWVGHRWRAAVWVVLALGCGDVAGTYAAAMGLALVAMAPGRRRGGAVLALVGVGWVLLLSALGANAGSQLGTFAYLSVPPGATGVASILHGIAVHPSRPAHRLWQVKGQIYDNLRPFGLVGILDPLMLIPAAAVLAVNGLSLAPAFVATGFQNAPVYLFVPLGTALLLARVAGTNRGRLALAGVLAIVVVASSLVYDVPILRKGVMPFTVDRIDAAQLGAVRALTPGGDEVIATFGVVGRFATRRWAYPLEAVGQVIPLHTSTVVVLAPASGNQPLAASTLDHLAAELVGMHAVTLYAGSRVHAYLLAHPTAPTLRV